ncbi:FAD-binding oxidoreductase [Oleiagrimonas sp.]|jgi:FAD/FMN-containing dehydrogenase|uniref:FAD-binding oxidoreductase n=1 Tax=Oleiagrimonas sp. TaxID=2010330 RepID=UPI002627ABD7|nr:FAD-binding oxidoreductase [Oleiagrimonas sp.]MDA3913782.1 FAD-binding oxidoreductase [Oleiagrimonas sp.]
MSDPIAALRELLSESRVLEQADDLEHYGRDWTRQFPPAPRAVVLPETVEEVQALVRWACAHSIALVPSGGRTGLSGGAVAMHGEVVLCMERMHRILDFDPVDRVLHVEAGVVTEALQQAAREHGLYYPVDFGSRGSSQIGGNIATNAGGIKVLRYGMTRDWVASLKVVTGNGDLLELNRDLVKNATGYDLRHLMIGSEGTLGVVVEAGIRLTEPPPELRVMLLAVPDMDALMRVFGVLRARLALTAFEFFTEQAMGHVLAQGGQRPFEGEAPFYVLAEFEAPDERAQEAALAAFETAADEAWVVDGVISQSQAQARQLWHLREGITESIAPHTPYKNDISVRVSRVAPFMADMQSLFDREYPDFEVVWFGHIGDGNLHIGVLRPEDMAMDSFTEACGRVTGLLCDVLEKHGGSISAEHGVGLLKKPYLDRVRSPHEIALMRQVKAVFDPHGILNPGKVFD